MSTIKEVANKAGVSVATVSRVINNDSVVRQDTRDKVLKVIEDLSYTPNLLGRHLRQTRTDKILVLVPSISNQFYSKIIRAMEKVAESEGFDVFICMTHNDPKIEKRYVELLTTKIVDGIIFLASSLRREEMDSIAASYHVVQCSEYVEGSIADTVCIDDEAAAYEAVSWFLDNGHSEVAFMGSKVKYNTAEGRENGYRKALKDHGLEIHENLIIKDDYSYPGGQRMAERFLALGEERPTAIFCISDSMAIGCINRLMEKGIKIPQEVSVMGFDDTSIAKVFCPSISTVSQQQTEIGKTAAKMLIESIRSGRYAKKNGKTRKVVLKHDIVIRETTLSAAYGLKGE